MRMFAVIISVVYAVLAMGMFHTWKEREHEIKARHLEILRSTYDTTIHLYRTYAETIYEEVVDRPEIVALVARAIDESPEGQARLRGILYRRLYPAYQRLSSHNLRQLHFHLPDGTSFLRFHRPERLGDPLADLRESIRRVNEDKTAVFGFEMGRIFSGFRYVFPLRAEDRHIGSVETSVAFEAIRKSMQDSSPRHEFLFLQREDRLLAHVFPSEREVYIPMAMAPGYVIEDLRRIGYPGEDPVFPLAHALDSLLKEDTSFQQGLDKGTPFVSHVRYNGDIYLVSGLPIHDVRGEQVAFIISYEKNDELAVLWQTLRWLFLGQASLLLVLLLFAWQHARATARLRDKEGRLRAITDSMTEALYVVDEQGRMLFVNPAMTSELGYAEAELLGQDAHALLHRQKTPQGNFIAPPECPLLRTSRLGKAYDDEEGYFLRRDGACIPVEVHSARLLLENGRSGSVVVFRNISERIQLEAQRLQVKKLESISTLAGGIAHDFNNLLCGILGYVEMVHRQSVHSPDTVKMLDNVLAIGQQATLLANQLRTFSLDAEPVLSTINLSRLLPGIVNPDSIGQGIELTTANDSDLWPVLADQNQLRLVLYNLLRNALEAMDGSGRVSIRCRNRHLDGSEGLPLPAGRYVTVTVEDSGQGIEPALLGKIFDPYFTTKSRSGSRGTGLGLTIVYSIMQKHHGHIAIDSTPGQGSRCTLYFPAVPPNSA